MAILFLASIIAIANRTKPYAIIIQDKEVCYLKDKDAANQALNEMAEFYAAKNSMVKAYNLDKTLEIKKVNKTTEKEIIAPELAAQYLIQEYIPSNKIKVTVSSVREEVKKFTPKPIYKKGKKMLAGKAKVKEKAVKGKKKVNTIYETKNGKIVGKKSSELEIIDKGKRAVIYKGILGLPEGENWKTYEGDPIFKDGDELAITAQKYLGLNYKYGGNSLKTGVDCVTFVWNMYKLYGINLGCSHAGLQKAGTPVSLKNAKKGDIVCYYGHVAIYLGDGKIIHASPKKGVHISKNVKYRKIKTIRRVVKK